MRNQILNITLLGTYSGNVVGGQPWPGMPWGAFIREEGLWE